MKGTSGVIANLAEDIQKDVRFSRELQEAVRRECDRLLLDVREVSVTAERGILRVDILVKTNRPEAAEHNAMQAAASACEQPMRRVCVPLRQDAKGKLWRPCFETARAFSADRLASPRRPRQAATSRGDAYLHESFAVVGRYMLLFCGCMGSGRRAARGKCRLAVSLMEDLRQVGFAEANIIEMLKSLISNSSDDISSTTGPQCWTWCRERPGSSKSERRISIWWEEGVMRKLRRASSHGIWRH